MSARTLRRHRPGAPVAPLPGEGTGSAARPAARPGGAWSLPTSVLRGRLDIAGSALAIWFFCLSLTPSLLPRPWLLQGLISGILTATGYLVGVAAAAAARRLTGWRPGAVARRRAWRVVAVTGAFLVPLFLYRGSRWQREIHELMSLEPPSRFGSLGVLVLAAAMFVVVVVVSRTLRAIAQKLAKVFGRWIPAAVARAAGAVAVTALCLALVNGLVANGFMRVANDSFKTLNGETDPDLAPPSRAERSGSEQSLVSWASLGRQGRGFIAGGPHPAALQRFSGEAPMQPIRVYVGLDSAPTAEERAALAVLELERTGAFSRSVLCIITATGTGWVDRRMIDPLEYMHNGDTAFVAIQYSYLPSWLSFMVDRDRARAAGRELFNHVYARWSELPEESRPKLLVMGKSLGAFGAESAFSGVDDMRNRTDGMLLIGPPNMSTLWREFTSKRDRGTRQVLPVHQEGATVRFASRVPDLDIPASPWTFPRVVYLQHASDPVVWWTPGLALRHPDWLKERRGPDVLASMRWYPFVTFWQLTADLVFSLDAPVDHGHNYGTKATDAWARIAPPPGWNDARTQALRNTIDPRR